MTPVALRGRLSPEPGARGRQPEPFVILCRAPGMSWTGDPASQPSLVVLLFTLGSCGSPLLPHLSPPRQGSPRHVPHCVVVVSGSAAPTRLKLGPCPISPGPPASWGLSWGKEEPAWTRSLRRRKEPLWFRGPGGEQAPNRD